MPRLSFTRWLPLAGLFAFFVGLAPSPAHAGARLRHWVWTIQDRDQIKKILPEVKEEKGVWSVETEHWIAASEVDAQFTAELAHFLETFQEVFPEIFAVEGEIKPPFKPRAIVYANAGRYTSAGGIPGSGGVFRWGYQGDKITVFEFSSFIGHPEQRRFHKFHTTTLLHEVTHLLLQAMVGMRRVPVWFNEGLATYFECWEITKSEKLNRKNRYLHSNSWQTLKNYVRDVKRKKGELRPLKELTELTYETWNADNMGPKTSLNYALSESFLDYLLTDRKGRKLVKEMYARFLEDQPMLTDEEIEKHERYWHKHIQKVTKEKL